MKQIALSLLFLLFLIGTGAYLALGDELPSWRVGGARSLPLDTVGYAAPDAISLTPGSTIELRGDSLVAGQGAQGSDGAVVVYGQVLEDALASDISVESFGFGGFSAVMAERYWQDREAKGALVLIAFGTNDAAPRGRLAARQATDITTFEASLKAQAQAVRAQGSEVAFIAPPPAGSSAMNARLQPYRRAVRRVGEQMGVSVFDPADAFARCEADQPLLSVDSLHLNEAGQRCLGEWLAQQLAPTVLPRSVPLE